jgi:DNA polymerase V
MSTIDQIQAKMGRGTIKLASEGMNYAWKIRSGRKNPNYTTSWDGLVVVWGE